MENDSSLYMYTYMYPCYTDLYKNYIHVYSATKIKAVSRITLFQAFVNFEPDRILHPAGTETAACTLGHACVHTLTHG